MTHSYIFFKNLDFLIKAARKLSLQAINILDSKLVDHLTINTQLLDVVQKDDLALPSQIINSADVASTAEY